MKRFKEDLSKIRDPPCLMYRMFVSPQNPYVEVVSSSAAVRDGTSKQVKLKEVIGWSPALIGVVF